MKKTEKYNFYVKFFNFENRKVEIISCDGNWTKV